MRASETEFVRFVAEEGGERSQKGMVGEVEAFRSQEEYVGSGLLQSNRYRNWSMD